MGAQVFTFLRRTAEPRDWSADEIAEFYRVESALIQAGLRVVSARGLTDESEPWFVFCRAEDDEVIIHFARIDGRYLISAPAYCGTATGKDFRALVRHMIERHPVLAPRPKGDNLLFHPAALLVVLVTSAFLTSVHAADAAPAKPTMADGGIWKHREAMSVGVPTATESQAQHEALLIVAITAFVASTLPEVTVPIVPVSIYSLDLPDKRPVYALVTPPLDALGNASLDTVVHTSHIVMSTPLPPEIPVLAPTLEALPVVSAHISPDWDPTSFLGAVHAIEPVQLNAAVMVTSVPVAHPWTLDPASGAQLVPLSALSSIPKADLSLLHVLDVPDNVLYTAALPINFSTTLQTNVHTAVDYSNVTHASSAAPATSPPVSGHATSLSVAEPTAAASASAPLPVNAVPAPANATTPSPAVSPVTNLSSVLAAVEQFQAAAVHTAVVFTAHAAIFYDVSATTLSYAAVAAVTYDFGDGFSISLVGLPAELPHAGMHVL